MSPTQDVLDRHLKCFGNADLDGILADYVPSAVLFVPTGPIKGIDALRSYFRAMFAEFSKPGMTFAMQQVSVDGEVAYIVWSAETADNVYELATDTFVVQNGKIVAQSFAAKITPKVATL